MNDCGAYTTRSRRPVGRLRAAGFALATTLAILSTALPAAAAASPTPVPAWVAANSGHTGAIVLALARDPNSAAIRYAGTTGGFARSTDNGNSWKLLNIGLPPGCMVSSVLVQRQQPNSLLAGCDNADYGNGLYRSDTRGDSWHAAGTGMLPNTAVFALAQSPARPDILLAASGTGIYRTVDDGRNWTPALKGQASILAAVAITRDPFNALTYYALVITSVVKSTNYGLVPTGVVKSVDEGRTWFAIDNDLNGVTGLDAIAADPTRRNRIFIGTTDSGMYRSTDGGNSWASLGDDPKHMYALLVQPLTAVPAKQLTPDLAKHLKAELAPPAKPKTIKGKKPKPLPMHVPETALILAGTDDGVLTSIDGGDNWANRTADANDALASGSKKLPALPPITAIFALMSFGRSAEIVAGGDTDGIYRSANLGLSWSKTSLGLPRDLAINAIAVDPVTPGTVYYGTQGDGVERSLNSGGTLDSVNDGLPDSANVNTLLVQPGRHDRLVAGLGAPGGGVYVAAGGTSWTASGLRGRLVNAVVADPRDPDTLYAGLGDSGIGWSADGGNNWRILDHGLPAAAPVLALAVDPHNALHILAGTDRGLYSTSDQGDTWTAAGSGLPVGAVNALLNDPTHARVFLAGTRSGLYRSRDGGLSWAAFGSSLGGTEIHALARDSRVPAMLMAATASGVFRSKDDGATWGRLTAGIPGPGAATAVATDGPVSYSSNIYGAFFMSPTSPVPAASGGKYFALTGHNIAAPFLSFWQAYGGLAVFGPPRTEAMMDGAILVQYFQRARLEYHAAARLVSLTPLGSAATTSRHFAGIKAFPNGPLRIYMPQTHHSLGAPFLDFWRAHGGAAVFGLPISEVLHEENGDGTGNQYVLQYFQNARLEYHPENKGTPYEIQLGLLGDQQLLARGWLQ
jgi:photosystem II stability/assembly factor-like uncharacterized protein